MNNKGKKVDFFMPAEWYPQSGIEIVWPNEDTDWKPYLADITKTYVEMANAITRHELLLIVCNDTESVRNLLVKSLQKEQMNNIIFRQMEYNDTWARDTGPITFIPTTKDKGFEVAGHILDFRFNGWGEKFASDKDNAINARLHYQSTFHAAIENHSDFVLEGGSIDYDGDGTLFTTSSCLLAPHRNVPADKEHIEKQLRKIFGFAERIAWIDYGQLAGDDTDGHIDTLVRCAPSHTLLYIGTDDTEDEHYQELKAMEEQLQGLRTRHGKPYRLMKLPLPDAIYDDGERLPATYANFVILNGAIMVPTYGQPEKDKEAKRIIKEAFPDREIIGIDAQTAIRQHGSLHCLTMHFPEGILVKQPIQRYF